jgi:hypothetical protein
VRAVGIDLGSFQPTGVEDDLAGSSGEDDARDGGGTWAHGDREAVLAEPGGEAIGVAVEPQLRDLDRACPMGCRGAAWERGRVSPFDEEGERGLGGGPLDPGQPPSHELAAPTGP